MDPFRKVSTPLRNPSEIEKRGITSRFPSFVSVENSCLIRELLTLGVRRHRARLRSGGTTGR
jgi:hypothetical protein